MGSDLTKLRTHAQVSFILNSFSLCLLILLALALNFFWWKFKFKKFYNFKLKNVLFLFLFEEEAAFATSASSIVLSPQVLDSLPSLFLECNRSVGKLRTGRTVTCFCCPITELNV